MLSREAEHRVHMFVADLFTARQIRDGTLQLFMLLQ